ncbi:serine protease FAM111A-like [Emydura macquarii macquarii]|uniref:serine protease FAM111A-like n=1 Tax=Emydura macquarii macquarii TaxID=1129001 RepID=UPI00352A13C1
MSTRKPCSARKRPVGRSPARTSQQNTIESCWQQKNGQSTPKRMRSHTGASPLKDIGNTLMSSEKPGTQDPGPCGDREFTVKLNGGKYVVKGKANDSIYTSLMALKDVQTHIEKQHGKELYLQGKQGIEAFVNLGMPLKCLPEKSHFEMKFYKMKRDQEGGKQGHRQLDTTGTECVVFYIAPLGKRAPDGMQIQKIMWCQKLVQERCKICIFAPKGEIIKKALCEDGRFLPILEEKEWCLVENSNKITISEFPVDGLNNRSFEVELKIERAIKARTKQHGAATGEQQGEAFYQFKPAVLAQYSELKNQSELIEEFFNEEVTESGKHVKDLLELHRKNFSKEAKNSTPVRVHKLLAGLSNSVGYIDWDYNGNRGCATCFVLSKGYILTCRHVVSDVTGPGVEEQYWAQVSPSVKVAFSYENKHPEEDDWFDVEPRLEVSDQALDYAVLKLKERSTKFPDGLAKLTSSPPCSGLIFVIGHPDGKEKSTDGCSIVSPLERGWRCIERLQKRQGEGHSSTSCGTIPESRTTHCIHMFTPRSFQEVTNNPDIVTYDTSFFCGSSGSPVFDASGRLIAMHTAGYLYKYHSQEHSVVEWGHSMEAILSDIREKNPECYKSVLCDLAGDAEAPSGGSEDTVEVPYNNSAETNDVMMETDGD